MKNTELIKRKKILTVSDIVIAALCLSVVICYIAMPLIGINVKISMTEGLADAIRSAYAMKNTDSAKIKTLSSSQENAGVDGVLDAVLGSMTDDNVTFDLSLRLKSTDAISALVTNDTSVIEKAVYENAGLIYDAVSKSIDKAVKPIAKALIKSAVTENDAAASEAFDKLGVDDEWIDEKLDEAISAISGEGATVASALAAVMQIIDDTVEKSEAIDKAEYLGSRDKIEDGVREVLTGMADENGNLNITVDDLIDNYLMPYIEQYKARIPGLTYNSGSLSVKFASVENNKDVKVLSLSTEGQGSDGETVREKLSSLISGIVSEGLNEQAVGYIMIFIRVIAVLAVISCIFWLYVMIKAIVKAFSKYDPSIRFWQPVAFGWLPFPILVVIPWAALTFGKSLIPRLTGMSDSAVGAVVNSVSATFISGSVVAFSAAAALFIFIFIYGRQKKLYRAALSDK